MKPSDVRRLRSGLKKPRTAITVGYLAFIVRPPVEAIRRFVDSSVASAWEPRLKTRLGTFPLALRSNHDVRTVHEIFCRHDYRVSHASPSVIVDVGGNIGISALYFLTAHPQNRVHVWEPDPFNLTFLRKNLAPFADRVILHEAAWAPESGTATFEVEEVGRYGGLTEFYAHPHLATETIEVACDGVAEALAEITATEGRVDIVKIDTEGSEQALVEAIPKSVLDAGTVVYYEDADSVVTLRR